MFKEKIAKMSEKETKFDQLTLKHYRQHIRAKFFKFRKQSRKRNVFYRFMLEPLRKRIFMKEKNENFESSRNSAFK